MASGITSKLLQYCVISKNTFFKFSVLFFTKLKNDSISKGKNGENNIYKFNLQIY